MKKLILLLEPIFAYPKKIQNNNNLLIINFYYIKKCKYIYNI